MGKPKQYKIKQTEDRQNNEILRKIDIVLQLKKGKINPFGKSALHKSEVTETEEIRWLWNV